uniref:Uncharacterized protein n=1 Tax=Picea sitchensis TaxID=3332 RepID=A0A6B9XUA4_PICSI|nr:hypothetical protein Q903MT_gene5719 [Picea sitchensis]
MPGEQNVVYTEKLCTKFSHMWPAIQATDPEVEAITPDEAPLQLLHIVHLIQDLNSAH